jgi:predicted amidophosphoribosyltransferase
MITPSLLSLATDTAHLPSWSSPSLPAPSSPGNYNANTHGNLPASATYTGIEAVRCTRRWQAGDGQVIPRGKERICLRHHKGAFIGCFSLRLKKNINWDLFKQWKERPSCAITDQIARDFLPFIKNHYDCLTTAPPSAKRGPRYCTYDLAHTISRYTGIPFIPAFARRKNKKHHGRFASIAQSKPQLLKSWTIRNSSVLFVDDCITSGTTARLCYDALVALNNHVDGLIWVSAGK